MTSGVSSSNSEYTENVAMDTNTGEAIKKKLTYALKI